jgi:hypothetical protein
LNKTKSGAASTPILALAAGPPAVAKGKLEGAIAMTDMPPLRLHGLAALAYEEFGDALDYVWKTPRFIKSEENIELEKLEAYVGRVKEARWEHEYRRLNYVFPYLMAAGNLFTSASLFETCCLRLCKELEIASKKSISDFRGNGISRLFGFITSCGINTNIIKLRQQVDAALTIRNCLFHASGLLAWSRDEAKLRAVISNVTYLPADVRAKHRRMSIPFDSVTIIEGTLGERIQITNDYAYGATGFFRDHFCEMYNVFNSQYPDRADARNPV